MDPDLDFLPDSLNMDSKHWEKIMIRIRTFFSPVFVRDQDQAKHISLPQ